MRDDAAGVSEEGAAAGGEVNGERRIGNGRELRADSLREDTCFALPGMVKYR